MPRRGSGRLRLQEGSNTRMLLALTMIIWLLFLAISLSRTLTPSAEFTTSNVVEVSDPLELPRIIGGNGITILYFKQELCPGCAKVEPAILRYASENPEVRLVIAHIDRMLERDTKRTLEVLGEFKILGTPTIIVYVNGREVGRHVSTFGLGDQYEPLKEFIEASIEGRELQSESTGVYTQVNMPNPKAFELGYIVSSSLGALGLGLIAALSPCSLPMVIAYSMSHRTQGSRLGALIGKALTLGSAVLLGGSLLTILYVASYVTPVNMYKIVISFSASLLVAWGLLTIVQGRHTLIEIPWLSRLLPVLGLQCSLPFIITMLSILEAVPHIMLLGSIAFTMGYITPYIAISTSADLARSVESLMRSKILIMIQGVALIGAGAYILYNLKSVI